MLSVSWEHLKVLALTPMDRWASGQEDAKVTRSYLVLRTYEKIDYALPVSFVQLDVGESDFPP